MKIHRLEEMRLRAHVYLRKDKIYIPYETGKKKNTGVKTLKSFEDCSTTEQCAG